MLTLPLNTGFQFLNTQLLLLICATLLTVFNNIVHLFDLDSNPNSNCELNRAFKVSVKASPFSLFFCHLWWFRHPAPLFCVTLAVQFCHCLQCCRRKLKTCFFTLGLAFSPGRLLEVFLSVLHISPQPTADSQLILLWDLPQIV